MAVRVVCAASLTWLDGTSLMARIERYARALPHAHFRFSDAKHKYGTRLGDFSEVLCHIASAGSSSASALTPEFSFRFGYHRGETSIIKHFLSLWKTHAILQFGAYQSITLVCVVKGWKVLS
jgi:hypothetical protein